MKNRRVNIILILVFIFGAGIICRLFFLQILNHKLYQAQALGQQNNFRNNQGFRGEIFFQNSQEERGTKGTGEIKSLAINKDEWTLSAKPEQIQDKQFLADKLRGIIGEEPSDILLKLDSQNSYLVIKKKLTQAQADEIKQLNLSGVVLEEAWSRYYPQERLASQTIGFLGGDGAGQYGIEGFYEDVLKGKTGITENKKGLGSIFLDESQLSLNGSDLYLTIDYNIQFEAESLLEEVKKNLDIEAGQIIIMRPDSGRVLAMANYPSFDPNQYSKESGWEIFQNSVVQKLFEPGSIMKPFTMSVALNEGKITPETTFTDVGYVKVGIETIRNFGNEKYGTQTMTGILEKSVNTGAVFVSQQISHNTYLDYIDKFGFTRKTGIDLQGETYSSNENLKNGPDVEFATASFGQGIEMTPIQMASAFCAFANGGKLVKPYIVEKIVNGQKEDYKKSGAAEQVVSLHTASQITTMLISVVEKGFGDGAKIQGYYLAGKTGTAEVPLKTGRGYDPDKTIQSFIGYGPALNPQFLILVKLDNPKVPKSSLSAVPVFKKMAQYIINYWHIPPDYDVKN